MACINLALLDYWSDSELEELAQLLFGFGLAVPESISGKPARAWLEHAKETAPENYADALMTALAPNLEDAIHLANVKESEEDREDPWKTREKRRNLVLIRGVARLRLSVGR